MTEPEWMTPEALVVQRDHWKARAEAAEAARDQWRENWSTYRKAWAAMLPNPGRWPDDANEASDVCDAYASENQQLFDRIADLEARLARVPDREAVALEALHDVLASLVAATSLAKRAKKAAPSDTMHAMMIADYEKSAERGRAAIAAMQEGTK